MGDLKKIALIALLTKKTKDHNGGTRATKDFTIKLKNGGRISVSKGQDIALRTDRICVGTKAFEDSADDNFLAKLLKTVANDKVSDMEFVDWDDIKTIV